jgi:hypothetical protein
MGLEGIVSKRIDSAYRSGPFLGWRKIKCPGYSRPVSCALPPARYRRRGGVDGATVTADGGDPDCRSRSKARLLA